MNRRKQSGAEVFMMEMIAVVCFFILCAGTCTLVFVKANNMSRRAADMNRGVLAAESVTEVWKAEGADGLAERFGAQNQVSADGADGESRIFWDDSWNALTDGAEGAYRTELSWKPADGILEAEVRVIRASDGQLLFSMKAGRQQDPGQGGA